MTTLTNNESEELKIGFLKLSDEILDKSIKTLIEKWQIPFIPSEILEVLDKSILYKLAMEDVIWTFQIILNDIIDNKLSYEDIRKNNV